jgi:hypothetical protein
MERLNLVQWTRKQVKFERAILEVYARATAEQIADGHAWYRFAAETLASIAPDWTASKRAAVCAVLSPRVTWSENITSFTKVYRAAKLANRIPPVCAGLNRNIAKAHLIALDELDESAVSGPKVESFYANLAGNFEKVTCDTWAGKAAGLSEREMDAGLRGQRYVYLEKAYQNVAHSLGFAPAVP